MHRGKKFGVKVCTIFILISAIAVLSAAMLIIHGQTLHNESNTAVITQYEDKSGKQGQFYTIKNDQAFIVIDGGNEENSDYVRSIIKEQGDNHVDLWIITHPHPDHVGAFNQIFHDLQGVEINEIRTIDMNYDHYKKNAKDWDDFDKYECFLSVTKNQTHTKVVYVKTGDTWKTGNLDFHVLSAYDEKVTDSISHDLCNDGSMMFKVTNEKESMLFCADVGKKMSKIILKTQVEYLPSDYVQMGHHGNGGPDKKFYKLVNARIAFFDAQEWLMNPDKSDPNQKKYKTRKNKKRMEALGAEVYYYATAPNSIQLK